jgi:transcriptional regulator with XRE-family HTH domain
MSICKTYIWIALRSVFGTIIDRILKGVNIVDNRVKELRKEKGLKQEELAAKINVSQQTISRIENGENSLPADILIQLSNYFHVSIDYILKVSDKRLTQEYQIELLHLTENHMDICRMYNAVSSRKQSLVYELLKEMYEDEKD